MTFDPRRRAAWLLEEIARFYPNNETPQGVIAERKTEWEILSKP